MISRDTDWKEHCHSSLYIKCLIVAKQSIYYPATYFDSTYRCEKEEELLRTAINKVYSHVATEHIHTHTHKEI